ncbi:hypothetical protein [Streptomyces sp. NBC_00019]|uniref:hypothetical protein n=1 Tax=Streptomyces sp. NBC_00019 TaxID=2975623 RepID=UPI0032487359
MAADVADQETQSVRRHGDVVHIAAEVGLAGGGVVAGAHEGVGEGRGDRAEKGALGGTGHLPGAVQCGPQSSVPPGALYGEYAAQEQPGPPYGEVGSEEIALRRTEHQAEEQGDAADQSGGAGAEPRTGQERADEQQRDELVDRVEQQVQCRDQQTRTQRRQQCQRCTAGRRPASRAAGGRHVRLSIKTSGHERRHCSAPAARLMRSDRNTLQSEQELTFPSTVA